MHNHGSDGEDYLGEVILGNYPEKSGDRLTQAFAGTFNHSVKFRKAFWRFIGRNPARASSLRAITQQAHTMNGIRSRLDTVIVNHGNKPVALIKNKIEAPLFEEQLKRYGVLPGFVRVPKVALVKNYFDLSVPRGWKIFHWSELHGAMANQSMRWPTGADTFIARNFLRRLEDLRMARVSVIERDRLKALAKAMKAIKTDSELRVSSTNSNIFETASDYMSMLEELVSLVRANPALSRRLGKTVRFSPWISWWWRDYEHRQRDLWIECYIPLRKKRNGIQSVGSGIWFDSRSGKFGVESYVEKGEGWDAKDYSGRHLVFDRYANEALRFWSRKLGLSKKGV